MWSFATFSAIAENIFYIPCDIGQHIAGDQAECKFMFYIMLPLHITLRWSLLQHIVNQAYSTYMYYADISMFLMGAHL